MPHGWEEEWRALIRQRDDALERSHRIRAEIAASFRRRQPPPMQLLRAADEAEGDVAVVKGRLRDLLHRLGGARS